MIDFSKAEDAREVPEDLFDIALAFHRAVTTGCDVELRVEDLPGMSMDCAITTKIMGVKMDEEMKRLYISAQGTEIIFRYSGYEDGSYSASHDKFYFTSDNASLTVIVKN